jgi:hypothetical protein
MILSIILLPALCYLLAGILFVIPFLLKGVQVIDEGAHGSSIGFYLIIIPGVILFWPVLLSKWLKARKQLKLKTPSA